MLKIVCHSTWWNTIRAFRYVKYNHQLKSRKQKALFEFYKLKSVSWKANLMTQKCLFLCLVSICLPEIMEFWCLVIGISAHCLYWNFTIFGGFLFVLLEVLLSCVPPMCRIFIKEMVTSQMRKLYLMKMQQLWL